MHTGGKGKLFCLLACFWLTFGLLQAEFADKVELSNALFLRTAESADIYRKQEDFPLPAAVVLLKSCFPTISARNIQPKSAPVLRYFCAIDEWLF